MFHLWLALAPLACEGWGNPIAPLDDVFCAPVEGEQECLTADEAADSYVGARTCHSPMRWVVRIGAFLERRSSE